MQPFERLRYLARWTDDDDVALLEESADCLAGFADDPFGVVIACRRLLAYHPTVAPLWWLCARAQCTGRARRCVGRVAGIPRGSHSGAARGCAPLSARVTGRGRRVARRCPRRARRADRPRTSRGADGRTDAHLSRRIRTSVQSVRVIDESELLVLEPTHLMVAPLVCGEGRVFLAPGTAELVAAARSVGSKIWLVVPRGFALPGRMVEALDRAARESCGDDVPYVEGTPSMFDSVVGPGGIGRHRCAVASGRLPTRPRAAARHLRLAARSAPRGRRVDTVGAWRNLM